MSARHERTQASDHNDDTRESARKLQVVGGDINHGGHTGWCLHQPEGEKRLHSRPPLRRQIRQNYDFIDFLIGYDFVGSDKYFRHSHSPHPIIQIIVPDTTSYVKQSQILLTKIFFSVLCFPINQPPKLRS